jgi:hypothetical protein
MATLIEVQCPGVRERNRGKEKNRRRENSYKVVSLNWPDFQAKI